MVAPTKKSTLTNKLMVQDFKELIKIALRIFHKDKIIIALVKT